VGEMEDKRLRNLAWLKALSLVVRGCRLGTGNCGLRTADCGRASTIRELHPDKRSRISNEQLRSNGIESEMSHISSICAFLHLLGPDHRKSVAV
jgi:hypothetical protein